MGRLPQSKLIMAGMVTVGVAMVVVVVYYRPLLIKSHVAAATSPSFISNAILTRALAIESPASLAVQFDSMPRGVFDRAPQQAKYRQTLWSLFFKGTMMKLGRTASKEPLALYYNPMLDVGVVQRCQASTQGTNCQSLCALPGEVLSGEALQSPTPQWINTADPLNSMTAIAGQRMAAFENADPPESDSVGTVNYCSERSQAAAEVRLSQASSALTGVDPVQLRHAIAAYIADAAATISTHSGSQDAVLRLLMSADQLSLTSAVALGDDGWLVFFTPKKTGWHQAALMLQKNNQGQLRIRGVRLLKLTTTIR